MDLIYSIEVPTIEKPVRVYDFLHLHKEVDLSRKQIKKSFGKGLIKINQKIVQSGHYVNARDLIEIYQNETSKPIYEIELEIIYEDDYYAIINKPSGILVNGNSFQTIENALPCNLNLFKNKDHLYFPQACHRLDYPTSGLLLIGKTRKSLQLGKSLFEKRTIQKTYRAVTVGKMIKNGKVILPIDEKPSETSFKLIKSVASNKYEYFNLVECYPSTGRRHQIRKHLKSIGHPILGDRAYGTEELWQMKKGLYLQSYGLKFTHPITGDLLDIKIDVPKKFLKLLNRT